MTEKKVTKRERFEQVMDIVVNSDSSIKTELVDFINHEVELLNRKANSTVSPNSKKGKELAFNTELKNAVKTVLECAEAPMRASEILTQGLAEGTIPTVDEKPITVSKISARLRELLAEGVITKDKDKKGNSVYSIKD